MSFGEAVMNTIEIDNYVNNIEQRMLNVEVLMALASCLMAHGSWL